MKRLTMWGLALVIGSWFAVAGAADVKSLRGSVALDAGSERPMLKQVMPDREPIPRDHVQQPPLVPHAVDGYQIDLKFNKCMSCHGWETYQKARATKISLTHFKDRDGNDMSDVSARRYFCTQCHVPQTDAQPLVENTFEPASARR